MFFNPSDSDQPIWPEFWKKRISCNPPDSHIPPPRLERQGCSIFPQILWADLKGWRRQRYLTINKALRAISRTQKDSDISNPSYSLSQLPGLKKTGMSYNPTHSQSQRTEFSNIGMFTIFQTLREEIQDSRQCFQQSFSIWTNLTRIQADRNILHSIRHWANLEDRWTQRCHNTSDPTDEGLQKTGTSYNLLDSQCQPDLN